MLSKLIGHSRVRIFDDYRDLASSYCEGVIVNEIIFDDLMSGVIVDCYYCSLQIRHGIQLQVITDPAHMGLVYIPDDEVISFHPDSDKHGLVWNDCKINIHQTLDGWRISILHDSVDKSINTRDYGALLLTIDELTSQITAMRYACQ